ncbi:MAG: LysM peptidoglycan-binding domain-containing protein [Candidatus Omnitrophota bacterium]
MVHPQIIAPVVSDTLPTDKQSLQSADSNESKDQELPLMEPKKEPILQVGEGTNVPSPGMSEMKEKQALPDIRGMQDIMKNITSGIHTAFNAFGYKGSVEVPEDFIKKIAYYIRYFSEDPKGSGFYKRAMARGVKHFPMIQDVFSKLRLPTALIYLPVVESGFNPTVQSHASAVGMWQFMKGTAKMYGLTVSRGTDERKDPEKATYAAAKYLNDLLAMFGMEDPFLGICAYNAGEGKILNALRNISYTERSFWTLVKKGLLREETDEYIPRLMAVVLMNQDPQKYMSASKAIALQPSLKDEEEDQEVIDALNSPKDDLEEEKPIPVMGKAVIEPPVVTEKISKKNVEKEIEKEIEKETPAPKSHTVKKKETVFGIAKKFGVTVNDIKAWNNLHDNNIHPGQILKVFAGGSAPEDEKTDRKGKAKVYDITYTVIPSDTLAGIALNFKGITARNIMKWNKLKNTHIRPGKQLVIHLKEAPQKVLTHKVKKGQTVNSIARQYKIDTEFLLSINGLTSKSRLKPGQKLKIYIF